MGGGAGCTILIGGGGGGGCVTITFVVGVTFGGSAFTYSTGCIVLRRSFSSRVVVAVNSPPDVADTSGFNNSLV